MSAPPNEAADDAIPVALPAHLRDAPLEEWFVERVRPLVAHHAEDCVDGTWGAVGDGLGDGELDEIVERMRRCEGAPERAALTIMVGGSAGYAAWVVASALLRDGVLVRISAPGALRVLRHPDGWSGDARLTATAPVAVAAGHPWSARAGVETVADRAALETEAVAEIARACTPIIERLATRSGRGRAGLWAQVADSVGGAAGCVHDAEPSLAPEVVVSATERLLHAPGAPWKQTPGFWLADADGGPVLVQHRGSCCLYYRFDPDTRDEPAPEEEPDAEHLAYLARFPDDGPHYCGTCLFRKPRDVEARMVYHAQRERAGAT